MAFQFIPAGNNVKNSPIIWKFENHETVYQSEQVRFERNVEFWRNKNGFGSTERVVTLVFLNHLEKQHVSRRLLLVLLKDEELLLISYELLLSALRYIGLGSGSSCTANPSSDTEISESPFDLSGPLKIYLEFDIAGLT